MATQKATSYFDDLSAGKLSMTPVQPILMYLAKVMTIEDVPRQFVSNGEYGLKITEQLTRLNLSVIKGNKSWEGLAVTFPGNKDDLATKNVGTPYLRKILYPILDLHERIQKKEGRRMPCIYLIGDRFSDVFLRKFALLEQITPHVIVLTTDLYKCYSRKSHIPTQAKNPKSEAWLRMLLCNEMTSMPGLALPTQADGVISTGLLASEFPCWEGTESKERLDILGYDIKEKSLIAFEIKGPNSGRVELENLFLQGVEHRNWLEQNKMAVKLLFDGPSGSRINTKKRVRLILGFPQPDVPSLFFKLRTQAQKEDGYMQIDFVQISIGPNDNIQVSRCKDSN